MSETMGIALLQTLFGLGLLYVGAEGLVRGSSSLALRLKVSQLIIGLTVIAYGTSMPECMVSVKAALTGYASISIGNVIGSNLFNICVVLGLSALIRPIKVQIQLLRFDIPVMLVTSLLFLLIYRNERISRPEGFFLVAVAVFYTAFQVYLASYASEEERRRIVEEAKISPFPTVFIDVVFTLVGLGLLFVGSGQLVEGAVKLARLLRLSEAVIGITIVAAGTSLPELATSIVASYRRQDDIAIGNVIGSNIFNITLILGLASIIRPMRGELIGAVDLGMLVGIPVVFLIVFSATHFTLKRWEGGLLFVGYVGYLLHLIGQR